MVSNFRVCIFLRQGKKCRHNHHYDEPTGIGRYFIAVSRLVNTLKRSLAVNKSHIGAVAIVVDTIDDEATQY